MTDPSSHSDAAPQRERLVHVRVADLRLADNAPKQLQAPAALVDSVGIYGILQPILVRPGAEGYEVVAGFKRFLAAKEAGLEEIPVRVYRVEDEALAGLYEASNVQGDMRRKVAVPPMNAYKPSGKLGGLLEEELNRTPNDVPYKSIMAVAATILLLIWAGLAIKKRLPERAPKPAATATPTPKPGGITLPSDPSNGASSPNRIAVSRWQLLFSDVAGVEVRNESGIPRVVFTDPVFSSLTTIDPAQKARIDQVLRLVMQTNPSAVLSVIGHTDNDPIRPSSVYRSNLYLSELRAQEVVKYINGTGLISAGQVRSLGVGADEPPFPNNTPASKTKNRTVTIEILQPSA